MTAYGLTDCPKSRIVYVLPNDSSVIFNTEIQLAFTMFVQNRGNGNNGFFHFACAFFKFNLLCF